MACSWTPGPLPADTHGCGAVVTKDCCDKAGQCTCFCFACFHGDHAITCPDKKRVEAADVLQYCVMDCPANSAKGATAKA